MLVIGVTGGIGTGKTAVSQALEELGAEAVDVDQVAHQTYDPGTDGWREVVAEFGEGVLAPGGEVDRRKLADLVFRDRAARDRLEEIVHGRARAITEGRLQQMRGRGVAIAVVDAPLLIEAGWSDLVDEVWVTVATDREVVSRVRRRDGLDADAIRARVRSQTSQEHRLAQADVVIDNGSGLEELRTRVRELWRSRISV